jgi:hypothetical protein
MCLRRFVFAIVLLCLAAPAAVHAQASERSATAEDLFRQALQLSKKGQFADACPRFAESHRLDPAFGALMNLGACYEKLGRTASAWQAYVDAADLARDKGQRARAESARKKASRLAARLVRLELRLGTGVDARGLAITRDGRPFDLMLLGHAVPVDPGTYAIVAARSGVEPWKTSVSATEPGNTVVVELAGPIARPAAETPPTRPLASTSSSRPAAPQPSVALQPDPARQAAPANAQAPIGKPQPVIPASPSRPPSGLSRSAPASTETAPVRVSPSAPSRMREPSVRASSVQPSATSQHDPAPATTPGRGLRRGGIAVVVGGVALAATGGVLASASRSISDDLTDVEMGERFDPARQDRARTLDSAAIALTVVGAAAVVTGATLYLAGHGQARGAKVSLAPAPLRGGAAATVSWQW